MNTLSRIVSFFILVAALVVSAQLLAKDGATLTLKTKTGNSFQVYVNGPDDASRGILLIHGWWGLNDQVRAWADKFADLKYRVMAVDLYNGNVATSPDKARTYMNSVKQLEANDKFRAALEALQKPGRKLATLGWSFGGTQSLRATLVAPDKISASVMYYPFGKIIEPGENVTSLNGSILVIRAKNESPSNTEETTRFIKTVESSGKSIFEYTFDAKHGFANPDVKHYSKKATEAAWIKTKEFLDNYLN